MDAENTVSKLEALLGRYLAGSLSAEQMIRAYDNVMTEQSEDSWVETTSLGFDEFQTELGLYVENPEWRRQSALYYGPEELHEKVTAFLQELERLRSH